MCTVTYLPLKDDGFILTSNRDESPMRKTIPPQHYKEDGVQLTYPKDQLAGGTWIGLSDKQRLICLLNGGFEKHQRQAAYRMSRGVVVKNILKVENPVDYIKAFDFTDIEPFTIVFVDWAQDIQTYELVWDGSQKHFQKLNQEPKIWSSSTLYDAATKADRKVWFSEWLEKHPKFHQQEILDFHLSTDKGTEGTALKMKRPFVETVSITSVVKDQDLELSYFDLRAEETTKMLF